MSVILTVSAAVIKMHIDFTTVLVDARQNLNDSPWLNAALFVFWTEILNRAF